VDVIYSATRKGVGDVLYVLVEMVKICFSGALANRNLMQKENINCVNLFDYKKNTVIKHLG